MSTWIRCEVTNKRQWTPSLFSLFVDARAVSFAPGQFVRLGLPEGDSVGEPLISRPYSFANPPHLHPCEFYFAVYPTGPLSPRMAGLEIGDKVWVEDRPNGLLSLESVAGSDVLWCLSTGTGLGPFLSILRAETAWSKFNHVVLVHAVRVAKDLTHRDELRHIEQEHPGTFQFVPIVSRERYVSALTGRIPAAIANGQLESRTRLSMLPENSHVMLCGNPSMIGEAEAVLASRGMCRHRRKQPGHISLETYW